VDVEAVEAATVHDELDLEVVGAHLGSAALI